MVQVPVITGITDVVALQNSIMLLLADDPRLANTPILMEVVLLMDSDIAVDAIWMVPKNGFTLTPTGYEIVSGASGLVGAGIVIEMPGFTTNSPAVRGSPATWDINIVAVEERNTNLLAGTGTGIMSEQYCEIMLDILHLSYVYQYGTFKVKQSTINPAHEIMSIKKGIVANRISLEATVGRNQSTPTLPAMPSIAGGTCSITCGDNTAAIYYTTDMSMPVGANANPNNAPGIGATLYTAPFAVTSGTTVLTAARRPQSGYILSPVNAAVAP